MPTNRCGRKGRRTLEIVGDGCFLISFMHVLAKNAKPLKLLLEGGGEKGKV